MTIITSVPASTRTPGNYFEFNIATAARSLTALIQRLALVGAQTSAATATVNEPVQVFSDAEADTLFGQGSEAALMVKWASKGAATIGVGVQIWVAPLADAAGTAATYTFTITGSATEAGEVVIRIAGRTIRVAIANGDTATVAGVTMNDAIDEQLPDLMVTAGNAVGVVTITAVNTGVNGNDIFAEVTTDPIPAGLNVVAAAGIAGAGATVTTPSLDNLGDKDYDVVVLANHTTADITNNTSHLDTMFAAGTKRWRHTMMAERGTLATAQVLATAADNFRQTVISAEGFRNTPGEIASLNAGIIGGAVQPNLPWNNVELGPLFLPDSSDIPTGAEVEAGINGGLWMLSANEQLSRAKIVRAVTTQVTFNSAPFFSVLDYGISRTFYNVARQVDAKLASQFSRALKDAATLGRIRSTILEVLEALELLRQVQNVALHAPELVVETDLTNPDRANAAIPASIVPGLNQIVSVINVFVE